MRTARVPASERVQAGDQRIWMHMPWADFEKFLRLKGEAAVPRIAYLDGELELMSPSPDHERIKSFIGRLVEEYATEADIILTAYGSWTLKQRFAKSGVEPDECYKIGPDQSKKVPDLVIEVVWTHGGIDKLEIYRRLGITEVWFWLDGGIEIYVLRDGQYARVRRSTLLPGLDIDLLVSCLDYPTLTEVKKEFRKRSSGNKPAPGSRRRTR